VTFEPDHGGWNNIRMSMEVVLVFAFVTGRTLVLPPEQPMYLLNKGSVKDNKLDFGDFFYLHRLKERMPFIEMEEFLEKEVRKKAENSTCGTQCSAMGASRPLCRMSSRLLLWISDLPH
jgi:hypothetical protein